MSYEGKVVIVTGAGKGIGRTIAITYAQQGARLFIIDKDAGELQHTSMLIEQAGAGVFSHVLDLSEPGEIEDFFNSVGGQVDGVDVLINNAGIGVWKSPYDLSTEEWDYVVGTNLRGTFLCSREAAKIMRNHGGGSIVNIASTRALMSEPNSEAYAASKGGILSLTHALALSLGPDHIRVNAISPGWIETGDYNTLQPRDHLQHPSMRVGRPEDIARACLYLTNPENDFITGINLVIDGGMTRKMIYDE
ncbi:SDR family oxidoreductase [Fodinisporobacter ferrooxydans]|uniref:SDR family oxidoreductase n=1 Tax=Fodinisporobacter ferrooxydans TaxID=2901836 RepID=A0ABY4CKM9_9BACL|nr:SDR family oxidoreductase [Alicyclobacillaceae bacterium MYW30-H2]